MLSYDVICSQMYLVYLVPKHLYQKSHDALDKYPTISHIVTEMCTDVHISVTEWCIVGYETGALWDLWDGSNTTYYNMTVWILAGNYISFTIAAGLIRLHMPGVKKSRV